MTTLREFIRLLTTKPTTVREAIQNPSEGGGSTTTVIGSRLIDIENTNRVIDIITDNNNINISRQEPYIMVESSDREIENTEQRLSIEIEK